MMRIESRETTSSTITSSSFHVTLLLLSAVFILLSPKGEAQESKNGSRFSSWLPLQLIPNLALVSQEDRSAFGFEWEAAPLLYSFGMTRLISPWHSFIVVPPARFAGSIELVVSGQIFTTKVGTSYFGTSVQLLGHIPLIERGEDLALTIGLAKCRYSHAEPLFKIVGVSTLFGFVNLNLKHSSSPAMWIGSLEFRSF